MASFALLPLAGEGFEMRGMSEVPVLCASIGAALCAGLLLAGAPARAAERFGAGAANCTQFAADASSRPERQTSYLAWNQGYLSAFNFTFSAAKGPTADLKTIGEPDQIPTILAWCASHPGGTYEEGFLEVFKGLPKIPYAPAPEGATIVTVGDKFSLPLSVLAGAGTHNCAQFSDDSKTSDMVARSYFSWAQGFMSGINAISTVANQAPRDLKAAEVQDHLKKISDYCDQNSDKPYLFAALVVYLDLAKMTSAPPAGK
jgi:hypothetical protein